MKYQLIACDLDETLLNSQHTICQRNIDLIQKAKEIWVKCVPATGRLYTAVEDVLEMLGLANQTDEYVLSANGGIISENKNHRLLKCEKLTFQKAKELFEFGVDKDVCIQMHTLEGVYLYHLNDDERKRVDGQKFKYTVLEEDNIDFMKDFHIIKVLYQSTDIPYLEALEKQMIAIFDKQISASYSSGRYLEMNKIGVNKGQGLIDLAEILQIPIEATIAVGDHYNDLDMLKVAGLSVAAGNAIDDIKAVCDYTTQANHNEGVVAELIEKFILE